VTVELNPENDPPKGHVMNNFVVPGVSECEFIVLGMRVIKKKKEIVAVKKENPVKTFFFFPIPNPPSIGEPLL
jgi:hypothetical protein